MLFEVIGLAIDGLPTRVIEIWSIGILGAVGIRHPDTAKQTSILIKLILDTGDGVLADNRFTISSEIVPLACNHSPSDLNNAELSVIRCSVLLEQTRVLRLTDIDTVLAKVIVVQLLRTVLGDFRNLYNTGHLLAVDIVSETALYVIPAVLQDVIQGEFILNGGIRVLEVAARIGAHVRIAIRIQTEDCLVLRFLREGVQTACTHIDLIADFTMAICQNSRFSFGQDAVLRRELDTLDQAQRVRRSWINSLRNADPVQCQGQRIGEFIKFNAVGVGSLVQLEVIVDDLQVTVVNIKTIIEADRCLNPGQIADTLCQLQQEGPRRRAFQISARQHVNQLIKTLRDRNCRHIHSEGVVDFHLLLRINDVVDVRGAVFKRSIFHITGPGQHTAAAGGTVKVEVLISLLKEHHRNSCCFGRICFQACVDDCVLHNRVGVRYKEHALHFTRIRVVRKHHIGRRNRNVLAGKARLQRQLNAGAVHNVNLILGEVQLVRVRHGHSLRANSNGGSSIGVRTHQIDRYLAQSLANKDAIFSNRSIAFIAHSPVCIFRQINRIAVRADTSRCHLYRCANRRIVILGLNQRMIKRGRAGSRGVEQQRGGNRSGSTVRRSVNNLQLFGGSITDNEGGRSAAVQVNRLYTAGFLHDVTNIQRTAARGERFLTSIQYRQNNLACRRNTDGGTRRLVGAGTNHFAISDDEFAKSANSFSDLVLLRRIISSGTHNRLATLGDGKEAILSGVRIPLHAIHDQQTARSTVRHIVAAGIRCSNGMEVGNVILAFGITVAILNILRLILDTGHTPFRILQRTGITIVIVDEHANIFTVHSSSCDVEHNLLAFVVGCIVRARRNTGSQILGFGIKHRVTVIVQILDVVTGNLTNFIRKGIAGRSAQIVEFRTAVVKGTGAFKCGEQLIAGIRIVYCRAQLLTSADTIESVINQIFNALFKGQVIVIIVLGQERRQVAYFIVADQLFHKVEAVHVIIHVRNAEGTFRAYDVDGEQQILANLAHLLFKAQLHQAEAIGILIHGIYQVNQVACPAGNVRMVLAALVVVGQVHQAKEVTAAEGYPAIKVVIAFTAGNRVGFKLLQTGDIEHVCLFSGIPIILRIGLDSVLQLVDIITETGILFTGHDLPGTRSVIRDARADVVEHQRQRIRTRILTCVVTRHHLQNADIRQEQFSGRVGFHLELIVLLVVLAALSAEQTLLMLVPAHIGVGRLLRIHIHPVVRQGRNGIFIVVTEVTIARAFTMAFIAAGRFDFHICDNPFVIAHRNHFLSNQYFTAPITVRAFGQTSLNTAGSHCVIDHDLVLLLLIVTLIAAIAQRVLVLTGIHFVPLVTQCGQDFAVLHTNLADATDDRFGPAVFRTGRLLCFLDHLRCMLGLRQYEFLDIAERTLLIETAITITAVDRFTYRLPNVSIRVDRRFNALGLTTDCGIFTADCNRHIVHDSHVVHQCHVAHQQRIFRQRHVIHDGVIAVRRSLGIDADVHSLANSLTGGRGHHFILNPGMRFRIHRDVFIPVKRTILILTDAVLVCTGKYHHAYSLAGGSYELVSFVPDMVVGIQFGIKGDCFRTGLRTGSSHSGQFFSLHIAQFGSRSLILNFSLFLRNHTGHRQIDTMVYNFSVLRTGGFLGYRTFIPGMVIRINGQNHGIQQGFGRIACFICSKVLTADNAAPMRDIAFSLTSGRNSGHKYQFMSNRIQSSDVAFLQQLLNAGGQFCIYRVDGNNYIALTAVAADKHNCSGLGTGRCGREAFILGIGMTGSRDFNTLRLHGKSRIGKGFRGPQAPADSFARRRRNLAVSRIDSFAFDMCSIVATCAGRSNARVILAPLVGHNTIRMNESRDHNFLLLHRKGFVREGSRGPQTSSVFLASCSRYNRIGRVNDLGFVVRSIVRTQAVRSNRLIVSAPGIGYLAECVTGSRDHYFLLLRRKGVAREGSGPLAQSIIITGRLRYYLVGCINSLAFNMRCVVGAYAGCGNSAVILAPLVGHFAIGMADRSNYMILRLHLKGGVFKVSCCPDALAVRFAGGIGFHSIGRGNFFVFNMRCVVGTYAGRGNSAVILAPLVGHFAIGMADRINYMILRLHLKGGVFKVIACPDALAVRFAGGSDFHSVGRGNFFVFNMRCVVGTYAGRGNSAVILAPLVGRFAIGMADRINYMILRLHLKGGVFKVIACPDALAVRFAGSIGFHSIGRGNIFGFNMRCVVGTYAGRGNSVVILAPLVGHFAIGMTDRSNYMILRLHLKGGVFKGSGCPDALAVRFAGGSDFHSVGRGSDFRLIMLGIVGAVARCGNILVVFTPGIGYLAECVTGSRDHYFLLLCRKCVAREGSGPLAQSIIITGRLRYYLVGCINSLAFNMRCVVGAYAGCGNSAVILAPLVGRFAIGMTDRSNHMLLRLHLKGGVFKVSCCPDALAVRFAGSIGFHSVGRGNIFGFNMRFVVGTYAGCGNSAAILAPLVRYFAECVTGGSNNPAVLFNLVLAFCLGVIVFTGRAIPVGGIAVLSTGGSLGCGTRNGAFMITSQFRNNGILAAHSVTFGTFLMLDTSFRLGGSFINHPLIIVTLGFHFVRHFAVAACRTGLRRIALFRTGRLGHNSIIGMSQRLNCNGFTGQFFITDRAVHNALIAAGIRTGCSRFVFLHSCRFGMTQRVNCNGITGQFFIAGLAVHNVLIAASLGTGRSLFVFLHSRRFGMAQLGNGGGHTGHYFITNRTIDNSVVAAVNRTGCIDFIFRYGCAGLMTRCINGGGHTGHFAITNRTIDNSVVAAVNRTGRSLFVFRHCIAFGMRQLINNYGLTARFLAAHCTVGHVVVAAFGRTACCFFIFYYNSAIGVTKFGNGGGHTGQFFTAGLAVHNGVIAAVSRTSRVGIVFLHRIAFGMAQLGNGGGHTGHYFTTNRTIDNSVVAAVNRTGRSLFVFRHRFAFGMTQRANRNGITGQFFTTGRAVHNALVAAVSRTGRSLFVFLHSRRFGMTRRGNGGGHTGHYFTTNRTIDNSVVAAVNRTGRFSFVFLHRFAFGMAQLGNGDGSTTEFLAASRTICDQIVAAVGRTGCLYHLLLHRSTRSMIYNLKLGVRRGNYCLTRCTTNNGIVTTGHGTGGFNPVFFLGFALGMTRRGLCVSLAGHFNAAGCAIHHGIETAVGRTGRGDIVFRYGRRFGMTRRSNHGVHTGQFRITSRTVHNGVVAAISRTGRGYVVFLYRFCFGMTRCSHRNGTAGQFVTTDRAVHNALVAASFGTSRGNFVFLYRFCFGVTRCIHVGALHHNQFAAVTVGAGVTLFGTGRRRHNGLAVDMLTGPDAVHFRQRDCTNNAIRFIVGAVIVKQLGRSNGNRNISLCL